MPSNFPRSAATPARILSICDDEGLRLSRELLLLNQGYETESVSSNAPLTVSRVRSFDLALICRSVDPQRAIAVIEMLRRYHSGILIACLVPLDSSAELYVADLEVPPSPQSLLDGIRNLLRNRKPLRKTDYRARHAV
jgi:DNA-binding response OmpR family regulator